MAFPALINVVLQVVVLVVGVPVVWLLSKTLKLHPKPIVIEEPKKETAHASMVILLLLAWRALMVFTFYSIGYSFSYTLSNMTLNAELTELLWWSALNGGSLGIIAVAVKITGQKLGSIGISRIDLRKVVALGLMSSAIYVAVIGLYTVLRGGGLTGFSPTLVIGFVLYLTVGFGEETAWRGYVQTRLVAYAGTARGVLATSLLFGIPYHFPTSYYFEASQIVLQALAWTYSRVLFGLLFGYIMVRSQKIVASSIFHWFSDWADVIWHLQ